MFGTVTVQNGGQFTLVDATGDVNVDSGGYASISCGQYHQVNLVVSSGGVADVAGYTYINGTCAGIINCSAGLCYYNNSGTLTILSGGEIRWNSGASSYGTLTINSGGSIVFDGGSLVIGMDYDGNFNGSLNGSAGSTARYTQAALLSRLAFGSSTIKWPQGINGSNILGMI